MDLIQNWLSEMDTSISLLLMEFHAYIMSIIRKEPKDEIKLILTPLCSILSPTATKQYLKQLERVLVDISNNSSNGVRYERTL